MVHPIRPGPQGYRSRRAQAQQAAAAVSRGSPSPRSSRGRLADVRASLARTSAQAAALTEPVVRALAPALAQARREVARDLRTGLGGTSGGQERYTAARYAATLRHLDHALGTLRATGRVLEGALVDQILPAGRLATAHTAAELARYERAFSGAARDVPLEAAGVVAADDSLLLHRFHASAARYGAACVADVRRELAVGVIRGETVAELTDRIMRLGGARRAVVQDHLAGGGPLADGLFARYRYWGERIARTETMRMYNELADRSIRAAAAHVPGLVRRWDAALDARLCPACAALHGRTAPLDGKFAGSIDFPPLHPNCRCRVGPWRADWQEILDETAD